MIIYKNIYTDPNKSDSEAQHWRRQFKRILVSKNKHFHNLTEDDVFKMERKLEEQGMSLKEVCQQEEDAIDFDRLYRDSQREAQFRRIVAKALNDARLETLDEREEFIAYAIGNDYKELPYQFWPERLQNNLSMIVHGGTSVYQAIKDAAREWKNKRIILPAGMN